MGNLSIEDRLALIYDAEFSRRNKRELARRRVLLFFKISSIVLLLMYMYFSIRLGAGSVSYVTSHQVGVRRAGVFGYLAFATVWLPNWMLSRYRSGGGKNGQGVVLLVAGFAWLLLLAVTSIAAFQVMKL